EMATLLPMLTLRLNFRGDLFRWNPEWDAQTRWEARRRQGALWLGCADEVELALKVIAAWEASGRTDEERAAWAAQFLVNHEVITRQILPERAALLQRLSAGMRGEAIRPVQMELLDRLRLVLAHSLPERVGPSAGLTIAPESLLYQRPSLLVVYAGQMPYKDLATGGTLVRTRLLARLEPAWFADRPPGKAGLLELARLASTTLRERNGAVRPHPASAHLALARFPMDSLHECQTGKESAAREVILGRRIGLAGPLREQTGRRRGGVEAEAAGLEAQPARPERAEIPASRRESSHREEDEQAAPPGMAEPAWGARLRLFLADAPPEWQAVDIYLDGVKELEGVAMAGGQTERLEVAAGDHELAVTPAGQPLAAGRPQARARLRSLEPEADYVVVMAGWKAERPGGYYVMQDRPPEFRGGRAAMRWTHVGGVGPAPEVWIGGRETRPSGYYLQRTDGPCKVQVYRKGERKEGKSPLAEREFKLAAGRAYTLVIARAEGKAPRLTLLADRLEERSEARGRERRARVVAQLIGEARPASDGGRFEATVAGYDLPEGGTPVLLLRPHADKDQFEAFGEQFSPGDTVEVEPVTVDEYPEMNRSALVVREPGTGLEIAVPLEELLFDSWGARDLLRELASAPRLRLKVGEINRGRRRVYLTRLEKLDEALDRILDSRGEGQLQASVLEAVRQDKVSGVAVRLEPAPGCVLGGLVWEGSLRANGGRAPESFAAGEKIEVRLKFTGGKVKVGRLAPEALPAARATAEGRELQVRGAGSSRTLHLERRMMAQELAGLLKVDRSGEYQWAVAELYRRSNQPRLEYVNRARLETLARQYPPGAIIAGCRVTAIKEKAVEVLAPPDYAGYVPISEWANYHVAALTDETQVGEELTLRVVERTERGELKLSRVKAALEVLDAQRGGRYLWQVTRVHPDRAELRLVAGEGGERLPSLTGVVWRNHFAVELPGEAGGPRQPKPPAEGEKVIARVIELNREKGSIGLTIRRAFEARLYLDAKTASHVGVLYGRGGATIRALEQRAGAEIRVTKEPDAAGGLTVELSAPRREAVQAANAQIQRLLPGAIVLES
ncbi:MAG: hypothetical protein HY784_11370, partial [Chloroflexi bacterium]|nr:hypothetical protein [Chloroflexota bacterium]